MSNSVKIINFSVFMLSPTSHVKGRCVINTNTVKHFKEFKSERQKNPLDQVYIGYKIGSYILIKPVEINLKERIISSLLSNDFKLNVLSEQSVSFDTKIIHSEITKIELGFFNYVINDSKNFIFLTKKKNKDEKIIYCTYNSNDAINKDFKFVTKNDLHSDFKLKISGVNHNKIMTLIDYLFKKIVSIDDVDLSKSFDTINGYFLNFGKEMGVTKNIRTKAQNEAAKIIPCNFSVISMEENKRLFSKTFQARIKYKNIKIIEKLFNKQEIDLWAKHFISYLSSTITINHIVKSNTYTRNMLNEMYIFASSLKTNSDAQISLGRGAWKYFFKKQVIENKEETRRVIDFIKDSLIHNTIIGEDLNHKFHDIYLTSKCDVYGPTKEDLIEFGKLSKNLSFRHEHIKENDNMFQTYKLPLFSIFFVQALAEIVKETNKKEHMSLLLDLFFNKSALLGGGLGIINRNSNRMNNFVKNDLNKKQFEDSILNFSLKIVTFFEENVLNNFSQSIMNKSSAEFEGLTLKMSGALEYQTINTHLIKTLPRNKNKPFTPDFFEEQDNDISINEQEPSEDDD